MEPIQMYCNSMEEVKTRISIVRSVANRSLSLRIGDLFDYELVCIHFRKCLELIAFASLMANKDRYAEVHNNFTKHWKAKGILDELNKIHPEFYPSPIEHNNGQQGVHEYKELTSGFLTQEEFKNLYDKCSEVLHTRNPFRVDKASIDFGKSIVEWSRLIQKLLNMHYMRLIDDDGLWVVHMKHQNDGKVHVYKVGPTQIAGNQ